MLTGQGFVAHLMRRWAVALAVLLPGGALAAPPPAEHFARLPTIDGVVVSPSGTRLAVLLFSPAGQRSLAVMNLDPISEPRIVGSFVDADVQSVHWVNDERLVYEAFESGRAVVREGGAGTFAVNHDGSHSRALIAWRYALNETESAIRSRILPYGWFFRSTIDDGSDDVFVYRYIGDKNGDLKQIQLARLNTGTGLLKTLSHGMPEGTRRWILDTKYEPRMLTAQVRDRTKVYWRPVGTETWNEVADFNSLTDAGFNPWGVDAGGDLLVTGRIGRDTTGLYRFDPVAKRVDPEPLIAVNGFDLSPSPVRDTRTGSLLGLHFAADRPMSYWFDAKFEALQRAIDAALPGGRSNRLYCGRCETTRFIVIRSTSDKQPGEYFLFDRTKASLQRIGLARPWIDESAQGQTSLHRIAARDGLTMPVYVTHPAGAARDKALPAVVLVHGGPWVRGQDLRWSAQAQFLASRGYRVLQPEFRGSEGYGFKLFRAGWKEWGRAMQDDLVDTVQWAARQGLVDASRVCIVGGSYGGYAALMGPIAHPGNYRCAASFAGVTDIELMYSINWSDIPEVAKQYGLPMLVGDPATDADRLTKASPLKRVAEIKVPVLLAHGAADRRVPIAHAQRFNDEARKAGVAVETLFLNDVGHGFHDPAKHVEYLVRLERFLEKSLQVPR
jgi:dipeptidyl aminopeptidase/acylaminoacyl peptidase